MPVQSATTDATACSSTQGNASTSGIEQTDGLVRKLPVGNITMRQLHSGFQRLIEYLYPMMLLHRRDDPAHHQDSLLLTRLVHLHGLEAPRERRILLDV